MLTLYGLNIFTVTKYVMWTSIDSNKIVEKVIMETAYSVLYFIHILKIKLNNIK